jgi:hypothetical protein
MNPSDEHPDVEAARRAGFDPALLDSNLALTPEERWRQHSLALQMALELQQARLVHDPRLRPPASPAR